MSLLINLFNVLFPVFLSIGIGFWYGKKDPKFDTKFIIPGKSGGNVLKIVCTVKSSGGLRFEFYDNDNNDISVSNVIDDFTVTWIYGD